MGMQLHRLGFAVGLVAVLALGGCGGTKNPEITTPSIDTTPPTFVSNAPKDGATNVGTTTPIEVEFSEAMADSSINSGTFNVMPSPSGTAVSGTIALNGTIATFTPTGLSPYTQYVVTVLGGPGGVTDLAGNALVSTKTFTFTTGSGVDTTPPTVTATSPANGATGVAGTLTLTVTFSEAVQRTTLTTTTFLLATTSGSSGVAGTVTTSSDTATFTPVAALLPSTGYTAKLVGGPYGVTDLAGNPLAADYSFTFTTGPDTTQPTVISTSPANGATGVATGNAIAVYFSEPMSSASIDSTTFTLTPGAAGTIAASGATAVFTPTTGLAASTTYTVTLTAGVKDLAGNALAAPYSFSFTTGP